MTKKCLLIACVLASLLAIPTWVSAEIIQDQPVRFVNFDDLLVSASKAAPFEGADQGEESLEFFAGSVSEAHDLSIDSTYGLENPSKLAKPKMKVLTCHVTSSTTDAMKTIFPWVSTGARVAHVAYFEVLNKSDFVKFKVTVQGPEFSRPLVVETVTFGPQEPLYQWGMGFWRTYSIPGIYKIKMTAIPATNHASGRSSVECSFRVTAPQTNE